MREISGSKKKENFMKYVIFDDDKKRENFFPITLTRSISDIRVGILKLRQRISAYFELAETNLIISENLEKIYKERHSDWNINKLENEKTIFINSRLKVSNNIVKIIKSIKTDSCLMQNDDVIAAKFTPKSGFVNSEQISKLFSKLEKIEFQKEILWKYWWDFISNNSKYIKQDFENFFYYKENFFNAPQGVTILNPYNIWLGENSKIAPGVVIDAINGPVIIDENASVMPNAVIVGPVYIGKKSIIKVGAKIYEGTSIGPVCKVGGEVEESIFQAFSNKQHDGFLGHSYIGEWVNIGADTNNSDLKNNYKNVESYFYPEKKKVNTKSQFVGAVIGDHTKTGINSTINTGAVIGVGCNLFGSKLIKDFISSYKWGDGDIEHKLDNFLETANLVKQRRSLKISNAEKELYSKIQKFVFEQKIN